ncbi:hypothetical protein CTAYLR_004088 [Chrysophaeum taylorii]|uniref:ABC transporter n=1 Tax=Chrysophaeum taylorii TaxID=2483200 RepID=A0AAD7UE98_9STRA|nr:hypothetical protein CTAYLR_004088 [Chrysophaeum taylorii]
MIITLLLSVAFYPTTTTTTSALQHVGGPPPTSALQHVGGPPPPPQTRQARRAIPLPIGLPKSPTAVTQSKRMKLGKVTRSLAEHAWHRASPVSRLLLLTSVTALVASKALTVRVPFLLQKCVDSAGRDVLRSATIAYVFARLSTVLASEARSLCYAFASQQATRSYARALFQKMLDLGGKFHSEHPTGLLSVAFSRGARGFQTLLFQLLFSVLPTLVELGLSATLLSRRFGSRIGATTLLTFALYAAFTAIVVDKRVKVKRRLVELDNAKSAYLVDALANYETVQLFDGQAPEAFRFDAFLTRMRTAFVASSRYNSILNIGQAVIFGTGLAACLVMCDKDLVAVNGLLLQLAQPMAFLGYTVSEIRQAVVDVTVTEDILSRPGPPAGAVSDLPPTPPAIRFENVTKAYGHDLQPALRGATFEAPAGKLTVLAGASGSGKSTALRLIAKLDDPTDGRILLTFDDPIDLDNVDSRAARRAMGFVPQSPQLFDETAEWNLRYGDFQATDDRIREALRAAKLDHIPLDARLGERAVKLSGGERQRLAVARALLRKPLLLCADEPTSAADAQTERALLEAITHTNATVIVVAHRLAALAPLADHLVVFDKGKVLQAGTHADLLQQQPNGLYASLWYAATANASSTPVLAI